jgi:hypothetical protein
VALSETTLDGPRARRQRSPSNLRLQAPPIGVLPTPAAAIAWVPPRRLEHAAAAVADHLARALLAAERNLAAVMEAAEHMGIKLDHFEAREPADLDRTFAAAAGSDAVLVQWDVVTARDFQQVPELAVSIARHL